eukprot:m.14159 g.14159  ORF g.14159 m.14159 type:complete len:297 (+) comp25574_c0_seq1:67-957(+)
MGRKKKKPMKPWCWYCERDFEDEKVLVMHQKAKHFKCHVCHKKMYTAPGLVLHAMQVHKENITAIPNCLPNRNNLELEIVGMDGIPDEDMRAYKEKKNYREDGATAPKRPAFDPGFKPQFTLVPPLLPGLGAPPAFGAVPPHFSMPPPQLNPLGGQLPSMSPVQPLLNTMPMGIPTNSASVLSSPAGPEMPMPLFPSAQILEATKPPPLMGTNFIPLDSSAGTVAHAAPITAGGPTTNKMMAGSSTSQIIHPEEDISLEELRSCLAKYHQNLGAAKPPFIKHPIDIATELGPAYRY